VKISDLFDEFKRSGRRELSEGAEFFPGDWASEDVRSVEYDSRAVEMNGGALFACFSGEHSDGHDYAGDALSAGARAILCERRLPLPAPQIVARDVRAVMGEAAAIILGRPAGKMKMAAVTGTNGKTTTAYILRSIARAAGVKTGMLGTIVYDDAERETDASRTTPEGPDVQDALARMAANGAGLCVMEASSHGLAQGRLEGCGFDAAGFSNLTPEHLEFHHDMENYFEAKRRLFSVYARGDWRGAVNLADAYGARLLAEFGGRARSFAATGSRHGVMRPDYSASIEGEDLTGMLVSLSYPSGEKFSVKSPLIGAYNAANILEAAALSDELGLGAEAAMTGIENCPRVPGRLERYSFSNGVTAFIDYAHSPDGMEQALRAIASVAEGRLLVLWGAGGDRTPLKRPLVGEVMARLADYAVISTDNPRSEDPADIARGVEAGMKGAASRRAGYEVILDRAEGIAHILDLAERGDVVLVAGKGPEKFMDFGSRRTPFSDSEKVLEWADARSLEVMGQ
jgi:UDP-N-acetylmuramoyl-L-alanyl-D-glutamate--2,6-diaminopimelate ligase